MGNHIVTKNPYFQHKTNKELFREGMRRTTPLPGSVAMKLGVITELENNMQHPKIFGQFKRIILKLSEMHTELSVP